MTSIKPNRKVSVKALTAMLLLSGAGVMMQSCSTDELTGQPSSLGNSIYERLQESGDYSYTIKLIDDLDQTRVLSQTGSKTLFVADDAAFEEFFKNNEWGVSKYEELTQAQKKLLLNNAMINNAYLVELLSNVSGNPPTEGECMRRATALTVYDSIARCYPQQMPQTEWWNIHRGKKDGIVLLRDNSTKPMIHFLPAFMKKTKITGDDLNTLTNGASNSIADAWVNGKKVIERDITCKNGYIHKVDGVMTPADNMAGIIGSHANMSLFSRMLGRYSAPYYNDAATKAYNRLYNTDDSVFVLGYFSSGRNTTYPDGKPVDENTYLQFDPGWNEYMYTNTAGKDLHYDAGAMLVPSNEAMDFWWNHDGKALQDMYGAWDNVPMDVLAKLMNVCMVKSFTETVPSKFVNIVDNTTKVSLGVKAEDVDSCFMGCNGVVYLTNKVFSPAEYSSVSFPALVNKNTMNVIYWAISKLGFEPYLNSMDSYYSLVLPTNDAMLTYIDPCSYGSTYTILYKFYYDNEANTVKAKRYKYNLKDNTIADDREMATATPSMIQNRLADLINNLIVVGDVEDGHTYYKTKSGSFLKVKNAGAEGSMTISGGLQEELNRPITVASIYDQRKSGNGKSYVVEGGIPLTSQRSTYSILKEHEEYSVFFDLIKNSELMSQKLSAKYTCADYNIKLFDAYNYTIYVPDNRAIKDLQAKGFLPTWADVDDLTSDDFGGDANLLKKAKKLLTDRINNFLRYHIQDNSVIIGGATNNAVKYETFKINPLNKRFFSVTVTSDDSNMTVYDQMGNARKVVKTNGLYNNQGREYWINSKTDELYNASDVVVHLINGALVYSSEMLTPWKDEINALKSESAQAKRRK